MERLAGKVAVVTGLGQGIGRAIAFAMAGAGAAVVLADINEEHAFNVQEELKAQGRQALAIPTDVACEDSVRSMVKRTHSEFGGVDILVNNAGIYPRCAVAEISEELWDRVIGTNLFGVFLCAR